VSVYKFLGLTRPLAANRDVKYNFENPSCRDEARSEEQAVDVLMN
jgi:hypothetical protein